MRAVKLPESLIPEIVEFARTIDSTLVDGSYGQEKVEGKDRLVDILFDELDDRKILERVAQKLLTLHANEEPQGIAEEAIAPENPAIDTIKPHPGLLDFPQRIDEINSKTDFSLTPDQLIALEKMKQFVQTPRQTYFRLTGAAPSEQNARRAG